LIKQKQAPELELPWENQPPEVKRMIAMVIFFVFTASTALFIMNAYTMAGYLSEPQIIMRGQNQDGTYKVFDDFREAYWWLRDNTPEDARVMAWWDYGYQINGVANRTTIADGNTWNHEHIALLGKCLVSEESEAHGIARHLADYVLVWTTRFAGIYRDDIAKMPHMARIAASVYPEVDKEAYFLPQEKGKKPTPAMKKSLLYKLTFWNQMDPSPTLQYFEHVYDSQNKMVRIYKVLDVAKRHPQGSYAPELKLGQFRQH